MKKLLLSLIFTIIAGGALANDMEPSLIKLIDCPNIA